MPEVRVIRGLVMRCAVWMALGAAAGAAVGQGVQATMATVHIDVTTHSLRGAQLSARNFTLTHAGQTYPLKVMQPDARGTGERVATHMLVMMAVGQDGPALPERRLREAFAQGWGVGAVRGDGRVVDYGSDEAAFERAMRAPMANYVANRAANERMLEELAAFPGRRVLVLASRPGANLLDEATALVGEIYVGDGRVVTPAPGVELSDAGMGGDTQESSSMPDVDGMVELCDEGCGNGQVLHERNLDEALNTALRHAGAYYDLSFDAPKATLEQPITLTIQHSGDIDTVSMQAYVVRAGQLGPVKTLEREPLQQKVKVR